MNSQPLAAQSRRILTPEQAAQYNTCSAQRLRIMAELVAAEGRGVVGPDLGRLANAPSLTKRISELRKNGLRIRTEAVAFAGADGSINTVARYVLDESGPPAQADLFELNP